jgi:hypothetical protein
MPAPTELDDAVDRFLTRSLSEPAPVADLIHRAQHRVHRRRMRAAITAGLVAALSVAGITQLIRSRHSALDVATRPNSTATPGAPNTTTITGSVVYPTYPPNTIQWAYRGTLMLEGRDTIDLRAYKAWHTAHGLTKPGSAAPVLPLWSGQVGSASVFVFETGTDVDNQPTPFVAVYVEQAGVGKLVADNVPPLNVPALSWTFTLDGTAYTLVLGPTGATISSPDPAPSIVSHGNGWVVYRTHRSGARPRFAVRACASCQARAVVPLAGHD